MTKPLGTKIVFGLLCIQLLQAQLVLDTGEVRVYVLYIWSTCWKLKQFFCIPNLLWLYMIHFLFFVLWIWYIQAPEFQLCERSCTSWYRTISGIKVFICRGFNSWKVPPYWNGRGLFEEGGWDSDAQFCEMEAVFLLLLPKRVLRTLLGYFFGDSDL